LLNLDEKVIGLKQKEVWRGFNPKRNGKKSCGVGSFFSCINWGPLNLVPNIILKKWNVKKKDL